MTGDRSIEISDIEPGPDLRSEDLLELSSEALRASAGPVSAGVKTEEPPADFKIRLSEKDRQHMQLLREMLYAWTGKRCEFGLLEKELSCEDPDGTARQTVTSYPPVEADPSTADADAGSTGLSFEFQYSESRYEYESIRMKAEGVVRTADGREINVTVNLHASRETLLENSLFIRHGASVDPLVINLNGTLPQLTSDSYEFDLDFDGKHESIHELAAGSGLLGIDLNNDGTITDGRELFGTRSGDGFSDLAKHDEDGNGWIDEADSIFDRLVVWLRNENSEKSLIGLKASGIGAISLQRTATDFRFKDAELNPLGNLRASGIFLSENGNAGTIHQIDLVAE